MCNPFAFGCCSLIGIESKISSLVYTLNFLGVRTRASCQGHITNWHYSFPWVCIEKKDFDLAERIIDQYNDASRFEWTISLHESTKEWLLQPVLVNQPLELLHEEVLKLTRYLLRRQAKKERL